MDPKSQQRKQGGQATPPAHKPQKTSHPTIKELQEQVAKLTDLAARAQADLQNFKMRMEREAADLRKFVVAPLAMRLLPVRDDLARALHHSRSSGTGQAADNHHGLQQILEKLDKVLGEAGVKRIDALGNLFDPTKHEVLNTIPGEKDRVLAVFEEGYELQGRILRPAKVQVGDGSPTHAPERDVEELRKSLGAGQAEGATALEQSSVRGAASEAGTESLCPSEGAE